MQVKSFYPKWTAFQFDSADPASLPVSLRQSVYTPRLCEAPVLIPAATFDSKKKRRTKTNSTEIIQPPSTAALLTQLHVLQRRRDFWLCVGDGGPTRARISSKEIELARAQERDTQLQGGWRRTRLGKCGILSISRARG